MPTSPIDATSTAAWQELSVHESTLTPDLRGWFADDPERATRLTLPLADLTVDLSKNLVTDETLALLVRLADEVGLADRLQAQLRGDHINVTEDRAVLHTALRRPAGAQPPLVVDGQDIDTDVQAELDQDVRVRGQGALRRVDRRHRCAGRGPSSTSASAAPTSAR